MRIRNEKGADADVCKTEENEIEMIFLYLTNKKFETFEKIGIISSYMAQKSIKTDKIYLQFLTDKFSN